MLRPDDVTPDALRREPANDENWNTFDEYVQNGTNACLYHYTRLTAFKAIVGSGVIWATHSRYLNDPSEATYGHAIATAAIERVRSGCSEPVKHLLGLVPRGLEDIPMAYNAFFASFSEHGNLLNQWIAYTPSGSGVAVGVDGSYLTPRYPLRKVLYDVERQTALVERIVQRSASAMELALAQHQMDRLAILSIGLGVLLQIILLCLKDPAFSIEQEWRLIVNGRQNAEPFPVKYRATNSAFIPYVELPLRQQPTGSLAVSRLILGPGLDFRLNEPSLAGFARANGMNVELIPSGIPFRAPLV